MGTVRYTATDGEILAENRNGTKRDYLPDPLGSTVALLDSSQAQTDTYTYWPYGEQASSTGSTDTPFRYGGTLGYHRDKASINVKTYVRARYLDHAKCRWLTQDPIGFGGGDFNLYRYVGNSPVLEDDPSGLFSKACYDACNKEIKSGKKPADWICKAATILCAIPGPQQSAACAANAVCKGASKIAGPGAIPFCALICRNSPGDTRPNSCCAPSGAHVCANHCPSLRSCLTCCTAGSFSADVVTNLCIRNCCAEGKYAGASDSDRNLCDTLRA